jgi:ABC-type transport system involved in multi-copper enzyme maturation permease subunit
MSAATDRAGSLPLPTTPSAARALRLLAGLSLRRARRGRLLWLSAAVLALPVLAAGLALLSGQGGASFFEKLLEALLCYLAPFIMAVNASATVAEEVQGKTITYLFSRPVPRWTLPVGKYLGNLIVNALLLLSAVAFAYLLSMLGEGRDFFRELPRLGAGLLAMLLAAVLYASVASAFGAMATSYPFVATILFVLVVEVGFSFIPGWFKVVAMTTHLRVMAGLYHPSQSLFLSDPRLSWPISLPVLLVMSGLWLVVTISWVSSTEYRTDR